MAKIYADLTAGNNIDLTQAKPLRENENCSFQGSQKIGAFDIDGELARRWLALPNPNGRPNADVVKPSWNGIDATRRSRDGWIIDFGTRMTEADASLFEAPFEYAVQNVKPERMTNNREAYRKYWWRHGEPRIAMRDVITGLPRYIATPHVSKHRLFIWLNGNVLPDKMLIVIARSDDATFGILHSRFHELWALQMCSWMGVGNDPRYTPTTCFETFPFPAGFTPRDTVPHRHSGESRNPEAKPLARSATNLEVRPLAGENELDSRLRGNDGDFSNLRGNDGADGRGNDERESFAAAAVHLNALRENWLNPPEWVDWVITPEEEKAGFPKRPVAKPGFEAELKKRTLTNLYNARPAWLDMAHKALDRAVADAYGWTDYTPEMPDEDILRRLLELNRERAQTRAETLTCPRGNV